MVDIAASFASPWGGGTGSTLNSVGLLVHLSGQKSNTSVSRGALPAADSRSTTPCSRPNATLTAPSRSGAAGDASRRTVPTAVPPACVWRRASSVT